MWPPLVCIHGWIESGFDPGWIGVLVQRNLKTMYRSLISRSVVFADLVTFCADFLLFVLIFAEKPHKKFSLLILLLLLPILLMVLLIVRFCGVRILGVPEKINFSTEQLLVTVMEVRSVHSVTLLTILLTLSTV